MIDPKVAGDLKGFLIEFGLSSVEQLAGSIADEELPGFLIRVGLELGLCTMLAHPEYGQALVRQAMLEREVGQHAMTPHVKMLMESVPVKEVVL